MTSNYAKFESETARLHGHGVPGATSIAYPALGEPIYFTEQTIPLPSQTETSLDGGVVWTEVPAGTYRIVTTSPTDRFASFLATCKPRRVVNANPPWGAYQLKKGEKPLAASNVAGKRHEGQGLQEGREAIPVDQREGGEKLSTSAASPSREHQQARGARPHWSLQAGKSRAGSRRFKLRMPGLGKKGQGPAEARGSLKDASGVSFTTTHRVTLPKLK